MCTFVTVKNTKQLVLIKLFGAEIRFFEILGSKHLLKYKLLA